MKLSDLKTGEKGVIVKVLGHGGFRKRIVEMGFIKGKSVEVILNAPLKDPVKYKIMGYEISLRHSEAAMIEIMSMDEAKCIKNEQCTQLSGTTNMQLRENEELTAEQLKELALRKRRSINVALVGNPNCGKTSLFNIASGSHEHVGNYSGVTVDAKEGQFDFEGYHFNLVDLPGTYSLSAYSPEELYVRKHIIDKTPDVIINVVDTSNLERNLYLTTQLIDMNVRTVVALNMYDELEKSGDKLDYKLLGKLFGIPMLPTVCKTGKGIDMLFHVIINLYEGMDFLDKNGNINPEVAKDLNEWHSKYEKSFTGTHLEDYASGSLRPKNNVARHIHINHGHYLEQAIDELRTSLSQDSQIRQKYSLRYIAIKLLEFDKDTEALVQTLPNATNIIAIRDKKSAEIKSSMNEDSENAIMDAKYGFISGALKEAYSVNAHPHNTRQMTTFLDSVITNKYLGFPIFIFFMWLMFESTFFIGQFPMDWINTGIVALQDILHKSMPEGPLKAMLLDGIIGGVGAVIIFLPQIMILYFFIAFMEDTGYMARAAFIMDKIMHKMGLHGKSFIPLIMGFGCNVPAIMATRTIESHKSRLVTMLILPFMSCSARLPIYIMLTGIFFVKYQSLILLALYAIGIMLAIIMSRVFIKVLVKGDDLPFVMELTPYRMPTSKAILRHTWERGKQYLRKMGGIILVASIVIWFLGYYPNHDKFDTKKEQQENSYIGMIGKAIEPVFKPLGFNWQLDVGLICGAGAKELVASTIAVLFIDNENYDSGKNILKEQMIASGITPLATFSFLLFVLIYFPCIATITAIKQESGSWKWALFTVCYTTSLAWIISFAVFQIGNVFL